MKLFRLPVFILLVACSSPKEDHNASATTDSLYVSSNESNGILVTEEIPSLETESDENAGAIQILFSGTFHGDEVNEGSDRLNWLGLFNEGDNYLLKKTKIITERVVDGLLDNEENGEKTGWNVETESGEIAVMLISGGSLKERKVEGIEVPSVLYPGDSAEFDFKGIHYLMYATGSLQSDSISGVHRVSDYNLNVVRRYMGKSSESTLVSHSSFDEAMTHIIWSGDLDGDNFIDFLIDLSDHYNVKAPTLFLSGPAGENEVAVPVAEHRTVGC